MRGSFTWLGDFCYMSLDVVIGDGMCLNVFAFKFSCFMI